MENKTNDTNFTVKIKDGVCYFAFFNELLAQNILAAQTEVISLLEELKIGVIPFIVDLSIIEDQGVKVEVRDFGKIISSRSLASHCSGVWIVGAQGTTKVLANLLNKMFMGGRIHLVETMEEAKTEAEATKHIKIPMLEQDI